MKRFIYGLTVAAVLLVGPATAAEPSAPFMELPFPQTVETGGKIEVREFFWYGCPHCYTLEPHLKAWLKKRPAHVEFVRTPGAAPHWLVHAQAYYTLESLDLVGRLHEPLFTAIQEDRLRPPEAQKLGKEAGLVEFAAGKGVDAKKFREAFRSFGVRTKVERAKQLNSEYMVSSVPTVVVDGRYLTSPSMAGGEQAMLTVVNGLIDRARRERAAGRKR
jgi:thiol:disulfide interchange protein DsbA